MNLSIWDRNVIHSLAGQTDDPVALDEAEAIYLNGPGDKLRREAVAGEWLWLHDRLAPMLAAAGRAHGDTVADVRTFLRDRHFHYRMAGRHGFPTHPRTST